MNRRRIAYAVGALAVLLGVVIFVHKRNDGPPCATGFVRTGARCCAVAGSSDDKCGAASTACPPPLVATGHGCDESDRDVVDLAATTLNIGPSDWEAEGRVAPRMVHVEAFSLDRLEVSTGRACSSTVFADKPFCHDDPARAAYGVTFEQARSYCRERGGRLPSDDEWLAAAAGDKPRRYPWGDTGAVCRRGAWGLAQGPCTRGATGPDTVGAHPDGVTPLGIHDLAGNVAEWVETCPDPDAGAHGAQEARCPYVVRGGSWQTSLATELRTWLRREVPKSAIGKSDPSIGFRCAYSGVR